MNKVKLIAIGIGIAIAVSVGVALATTSQDVQTNKIKISEEPTGRQIEVNLEEKIITSDKP